MQTCTFSAIKHTTVLDDAALYCVIHFFISCEAHTALFQTGYIKDITQPNSVKVVQSCTLVKIIYFS